MAKTIKDLANENVYHIKAIYINNSELSLEYQGRAEEQSFILYDGEDNEIASFNQEEFKDFIKELQEFQKNLETKIKEKNTTNQCPAQIKK